MKDGATSTSTQENTSVHIAGEQDGKIWTFGLGGIILSVIYLILYDSPCSCPCSSDHNPRRANFHWTHVRPDKLNYQKRNLKEKETNWTTWWRHRWNRRCRGSSVLDGDLRPREPPLARCPHSSTALGVNILTDFWKHLANLFEQIAVQRCWRVVYWVPVVVPGNKSFLALIIVGQNIFWNQLLVPRERITL